MKTLKLFLVSTALTLSACASLPERPSLQEPATDTAIMPDGWSERLRSDRDAFANAPSQTLWAGFDDPKLLELIELTLSANPQIREAQARIAQAEAALRVVRSAALPVVSASSAAQRERTSLAGPGPQRFIPGIDLEETAFSLGGRASWEPDIWGRTALSEQAAGFQKDAAIAQAAGVSLALQNQTARLYINLRAAQAQRRVLENNLALTRRMINLTQQLFSQELAPEFDVIQARTRASQIEVQIETVDSQIITLAYALATITGRAPAQDELLVAKSSNIPDYEAGIPSSVPSDLLSRRPDIMAARARLLAANAQRDIAQLNRLPSFALTGEGGLLSTSLEDLITADARRGVISAALNWPIFAGGRLQAERDNAGAVEAQFEAQYDQVVLTSLNDVETAFQSYVSAKRQLAKLKSLNSDLQQTFKLAELRYRSDLSPQFEVLDARAALLSNQSSIETAKADIALALIEINAALGGYWAQ